MITTPRRLRSIKDGSAAVVERPLAVVAGECGGTIELRGRTLLSRSKLTNRGGGPLKLEWFAHPFFALPADGKMRATLPAGTTLPDNPGYDLAHNELTMRRAFVGVHDGCLVHLGLPAGHPFAATMTHPRLQWVRFATDFAPPWRTRYAKMNTRVNRPAVRAAVNATNGTLNAPEATLVSFVDNGLIVLAKIASHPY